MIRPNKNIPALLAALKKEYSDAHCALRHSNPLELLVATILSAQCTDERVNIVTKDLFQTYRSPSDFAAAPQSDLERAVHSTGFFRNKAKNIRETARLVLKKHGGQIPRTMDELLELPGVARKTANVVLGNAFGVAVGVVVDTHVMRLSGRLGLSQETTPEKIEKDLMRVIPQNEWIWISHALISHGRKVCMARNPRCGDCPIRNQCPNPVSV